MCVGGGGGVFLSFFLSFVYLFVFVKPVKASSIKGEQKRRPKLA